MLNYCRSCIMPDTKPDLHFDEHGICAACRNYRDRKEIDWADRYRQLQDIAARYRSKNGSWDCVVPVSGGKDSTFQVVRIKELGLNPLCVTASTCSLSAIGRKNIENIKRLGVDLLEFSPNPIVRAKLNRIGLQQVGDISWPEHVGIFSIPVAVATKYQIPLIVWGENSQHEYGGPAAAAKNSCLDRRWLEEFGGLLGLRVTDLVGLEGIEEKDLIAYTYPSDEELKRVGVTGIFLGYFVPWDGYSNALIAQGYGFTTYQATVEGSLVNYENLDNNFHGIHDYFKFLKFGFGRATDLACMHIRRGRLARADAIKLVKIHDGKYPWSYLGTRLEDMLKGIDLTLDEFNRICDRFTNRRIFVTDGNGQLTRDRDNNLTKLNYDNV